MNRSVIGIQTSKSWFAEENPLESLYLIKRCGFQAIDYNVGALFLDTFDPEALTSFFDRNVDALYAHYRPFKEALEKTGIEISQFHGLFFLYEPGNEAKNTYYIQVTEKMLALCAYLGCKAMVIHPWIDPEGDREAERQANLSQYRRMIPAAKKYGVTVCLENIFTIIDGKTIQGPCGDAEEACRYIDALNGMAGEEVFGFCLDVGHANMFRADLYPFITGLGSRLKVTHIHDNDGVHDLHAIPFTQQHPNSADPALLWEAFIRGLRESGYEGPLSFETVLGEAVMPHPIREDALKLIRAIGGYFRSRMEEQS